MSQDDPNATKPEDFMSEKVILLIDDDDMIRLALSKLLTRENYLVVDARNGREALAIMENVGVDLVITDIFMPQMDGLEVIRAIRKKNKDLKVIAISGGGQMHLTESLKWAKAFGANQTLSKPIQPKDLLVSIEAVLLEST